MRLGRRTYDRLLRVIPRLYACARIVELTHLASSLAMEVIEAEGVGWFDFKTGSRVRLVEFAESRPAVITPAALVGMPPAVASHPFLSHWISTGDLIALKMSDFSQREVVTLSLRRMRPRDWN